MFAQLYPIAMAVGLLPISYTRLDVENVKFDAATAVNDVVQFDTGLTVATHYGTATPATSAWGYVIVPLVTAIAAPKHHSATAIFGVCTKAAVAAAGTGTVTVIGQIVVKAASHTAAVGNNLSVSHTSTNPGTRSQLYLCLAPTGAVTTTSFLKKIVAWEVTTTGTVTTPTVFFNGFGIGFELVTAII